MDFGTIWNSLRPCMAVEQGCVAAAACKVCGKTWGSWLNLENFDLSPGLHTNWQTNSERHVAPQKNQLTGDLVCFHLRMPGIPQSECMATHLKNAHQYPGKTVELKARWTKAQIEQDRELLKIAKEEKEAKKQAGIMCVARLKNKMAAKDNNTDSAYPRHWGKVFQVQATSPVNLLQSRW